MKKRIFALALALALSLSLGTGAMAAEDSTGNFVRTRTYDGQFSDLTADSVFYDNVTALYEYGLSIGKADGTFGVRDALTVGQVVIFAGRIRSLYRTGDAEAGPNAYGGDGDSSAAIRYLRYLQAEGVIGTELDGQLSSSATRAQTAHVLANTLPEAALPPVYGDLVAQAYASRRFITDVTEYTPYYRDILTLYRTGVSVGSDSTGSFLPDQPITRGAAAAMLTRMVDPSLRVSPGWDLGEDAWSAQGTMLGDLVPLGIAYHRPQGAAGSLRLCCQGVIVKPGRAAHRIHKQDAAQHDLGVVGGFAHLVGALQMDPLHGVLLPGGGLPGVHSRADLEGHQIPKKLLRYGSKHGVSLPIRPVCSSRERTCGLTISCAAVLPLLPVVAPPFTLTLPTVKPWPVWPVRTASRPFCT